MSQASLQTLETINKEYELRKGQIMDNTKSHHLDWLTFFFFFTRVWTCVNLVDCRFNRRKGLRSIAVCVSFNKPRNRSE